MRERNTIPLFITTKSSKILYIPVFSAAALVIKVFHMHNFKTDGHRDRTPQDKNPKMSHT